MYSNNVLQVMWRSIVFVCHNTHSPPDGGSFLLAQFPTRITVMLEGNVAIENSQRSGSLHFQFIVLLGKKKKKKKSAAYTMSKLCKTKEITN